MSKEVLRRAQLDEKIKQQIRKRVKKLLQQKQQDGDSDSQPDTAEGQSDEQPEASDGTVYLFDASDHSRSMIALEFDTRKEFEKYKETHDLDPGTKVKILDEGKSKGGKPEDEGGEKRGPAKDDQGGKHAPAKKDDEGGKQPAKKPDEKPDKPDKKPDDKGDEKAPKQDEGEKKPEARQPGQPLEHSHPARIPEGMHRQVAIKDRLIDEFGAEAKDWKVHKLSPSQLTHNVDIKFPDGSTKKYGDLSADEKARVDKAVGEGLAASKGLGDYSSVSPAAFQHNMATNLSRYDDQGVEEAKVEDEEPATSENVGKLSSAIRENGRTILKKYAKSMSSVSRPMAERFVDDLSSTISEGVRDGSLAGIKQSDLDGFVRESVKRMVHQEIETRRRSLGDHGIRHVAGNCRSSMTMLNDLQGSGMKITGKQKFMALAAMVDHDIGYTVGDAAMDASKGKKHKQYSKDVVDQEKERMDTIFGKEDGDRVRAIIATHDDPIFDWEKDPVASTVRLADNTALFGEDKVQDLFLRSPKATELACKLYLAASAKSDDKKLQEGIKAQLHEVIDGGEFDEEDRESLHNQVDEMSEGKFSTSTDILSRFSGELKGFKYDPDKKVMHVNMQYSSEGQMVDQLFGDDVACKQFDKFAKDLGGKPVRGKRGNTVFNSQDTGKPAFQLDIDGFDEKDEPQTAAMRDFSDKTARSELRRASMMMYPPPDATEKDMDKAKKALEPAKEKFSEAEWKKLMAAFDDGKGDPVALAKSLGMWPLLQSEMAFLTGKTASDRIARRIVISALADRIARDYVAGWAVTDPEIIEELKREGFRPRMGYWVKTFNFDPQQQPDFEEEWRAEMGPDNKLFFRSRWPRAGRGWGSSTRQEFWPKSLLRFADTTLMESPGIDREYNVIEAARGQQTQRKDKDLMNDTGGVSKNRQRDPEFKPPRSDSHNRYRTKDKTPDQRDPDTDRKASVHPLDETCLIWGGIESPVNNYHRLVWGKLVDILADVQQVSEKAFDERDRLHAVADGLIRSPKGEEMIQVFIGVGARPEMCAEGLYFEMVMKGKTSSGRFESMARSQLSSSPNTLREAVRRG